VSGILDSKSRVIDFSLTRQGKAQLASGKIRFDKATVSDRSSFYEKDENGATDATRRIYFETYSMPYDQITLESDDSGQLLPFEGTEYTYTPTGVFTPSGDPVNDANFFASFGQILAGSSASNLDKLKVLITDDPDDKQKTEFALSGDNFIFIPSIPDFTRNPDVHIDEIESLLFDKRLSSKPNFRFLPPVNVDGRKLGNYADVRQQIQDDSGEDVNISKMLSGKSGTKYQIFTTKFPKTSPKNNLNIQIFETSRDAGLRKLDLIDAGIQKYKDKSAHVVFAGRVLRNSFQFPVFVNILTLVLI
jgi:hypothetical protein